MRTEVKRKSMKINRKHREVPIGLFFLKYFLYIFVGIILVVMILACVLFGILLSGNLVYPARYAEEQARLAVVPIQTADQVTEDLIPELCRYVVFDHNGQVMSADLSNREAEHAWNVINGKEPNGGNYIGAYYYLGIPRESECCVLRFQLIAQYRSALLRKYLPQPEVLLLVVFLVLVFVIILSVAVRFNRVVRRELSPLADAAAMIQRQELEFDIVHGSVKEINTILNAMDDMRRNLKESLENQWRMEQMKNEQLSALAHDLKTPLTLVRGNTELLADTLLSEEQKEYGGCIMDSTLRMQEYVQTMIEITRSCGSIPLSRCKTDLDEFLRGLRKQAGGLCAIRNIGLKWNCAVFTKQIYAEPTLLSRALMNVFANAVEHTPRDGTILFEGSEDETHFIFTVSDTGKGFTQKALRHAKEQFYMDDDSRTAAGSHYGMGLYIVDTIVKQHNGLLILENVSGTSGSSLLPENTSGKSGAKVTIKIPLSM